MELGAILGGLQLAADTGFIPCRIDSDAAVVVGWINNRKPLCSDVGIIIADIQAMLEQVPCVSVNFVPRKANQVAHVLAKNSLSCVEDLFWLEDFPSCVRSLISAECRGSL